MSSENDIPIKIKHYSVDAIWNHSPAFFWKPLTVLCFAAIILAIPFIILLILLMIFWGWLTGYNGGWGLDEVDQYLRSIINTKDETQLNCLMDDVDCLFLYNKQPDPFLERVRVRWLESTEKSGWGGPGGFIDMDDLRLILEDVQAYRRTKQTG
tara:strand:- start:119 stop:580 length:462 start_codon:yes stop_codon:yes gene_type:complete